MNYIKRYHSCLGKALHKVIFQESTRNACALATICPLIFIFAPFFQYWLFYLYHKYGHPWSQIIFPDQDEYFKNLKRKKKPSKPDADVRYFCEFWKIVEKEYKAKMVTSQVAVGSVQSSILTLDSV